MSKFYAVFLLIPIVVIIGILISYFNHDINFQRDNNVMGNKLIILNGTTFGPSRITSTTNVLFGIGFDQIIHIGKYLTGNYNFVLKPGYSGTIGTKYIHLPEPCNGVWQHDVCLTTQQQNTSGNGVIQSYPSQAPIYKMPDSIFVGSGSADGITITEQWKNLDNFTSYVNYTISTTPQVNGTYRIILPDSGPGQFLTVGTTPYNGTFPNTPNF